MHSLLSRWKKNTVLQRKRKLAFWSSSQSTCCKCFVFAVPFSRTLQLLQQLDRRIFKKSVNLLLSAANFSPIKKRYSLWTLSKYPNIIGHECLSTHQLLSWRCVPMLLLYTISYHIECFASNSPATNEGVSCVSLPSGVDGVYSFCAERIYTTTYYIPSSPTEVRAYTPILPGIILREPWLNL